MLEGINNFINFFFPFFFLTFQIYAAPIWIHYLSPTFIHFYTVVVNDGDDLTKCKPCNTLAIAKGSISLAFGIISVITIGTSFGRFKVSTSNLKSAEIADQFEESPVLQGLTDSSPKEKPE